MKTTFERLKETLKDLTERNCHSEANRILAEYNNTFAKKYGSVADKTQATRVLRWAKWVEKEHQALGYMPYALYEFRCNIYTESIELINRLQGEEIMDEIRKVM